MLNYVCILNRYLFILRACRVVFLGGEGEFWGRNICLDNSAWHSPA